MQTADYSESDDRIDIPTAVADNDPEWTPGKAIDPPPSGQRTSARLRRSSVRLQLEAKQF